MPTKQLFQFDAICHEYKLGNVTKCVLNNISFQGSAGKTVGVVGESGSGKSTLAKILVGLLKPTSGKAIIKGVDCHDNRAQTTKLVQMLFQDPESSFNPRKTIQWHYEEALSIHFPGKNPLWIKHKIAELLESVQLPLSTANRYPYELSGGQKQRAALGRALAPKPKLLILDEPLASLDVPLRKQIIDLLLKLQREQNLGYLFITHDLSTLKYIAHDVAVLCEGNLIEFGTASDILSNPKEGYTQRLISAVPDLIPRRT